VIISLCITTSACTNYFDKTFNSNSTKEELIEVKNTDGSFSYKNSSGNIIFENLSEALRFVDNVSVINKNLKYGLVNKAGEFIIDPIYDFMGDFHDGLCAFFLENVGGGVKIGYINTKGEVIINPIPTDIKLNSDYTYDYNFYNGIALYRQPNTYKYGYLDKTGKFIIKPTYVWAEPFSAKIAPVSKGGDFGYINTSGTLVIPYKFKIAEAFSEGLSAVFNGTTWGYIDETGNYVIASKFGSFEGHDGEEVANPFIDGYAAVYLGTGQAYYSDIRPKQFALIDKNGNILNNQKYDSLRLVYYEPQKPVYEAVVDGRYLTISTKGKILKEEKY
jgi:hypothetical protein